MMVKNITKIGITILKDRYVSDNEKIENIPLRICEKFKKDDAHCKRMLKYINDSWFIPSTPILSNGGSNRGLCISCFVNKVDDNIESITKSWYNNANMSARGGGIGTCYSNVRSASEKISDKGVSSGVLPFIKVNDSISLGINQGSLRRGASAVYLHISHPDIMDFLSIRQHKGDINRKALNMHHGVVISNKFMECLKDNKQFELISPLTGEVTDIVNPREIFTVLLKIRLETGEPYILYEDNVNDRIPTHHKELNLNVSQSNLCSEITLHTGVDYLGNVRDGVCCLGSVNLEYFYEWRHNKDFIMDIMLFLDNVLSDFIKETDNVEAFKNANYSSRMERSIGLGVMGFHSLLQINNIAFESEKASEINKVIFKHIKKETDKNNIILGKSLGHPKDFDNAKIKKRFSNVTAIAPTSNISIIAGETSPAIEPYMANIYTLKTLSGSFEMKNKHLVELLNSKGKNKLEVWNNIIENDGSVKDLKFLTSKEKDVFKTAFEINNESIINLAIDRLDYIDQSQSINLFLDGDTSIDELVSIHYNAWKKGLKSLYYIRSKSISRASFVKNEYLNCDIDNGTCDSCQ